MNKKPCSHQLLASSDIGKVLICRDCGIVQLQVQNIALRYDLQDFLELADLQVQASRKIRAFKGAKSVQAQLTLVK